MKYVKSYGDAIKALRRCAQGFTPERYAEAVVALGMCWQADEAQTLDECCRIANDNTLMRLAAKVDAQRREWAEA